MEKIRYSFTIGESPLPLYVESIGMNPIELTFKRPEGYPYFHWLQSIAGMGEFALQDKKFHLTKGQGVLLPPGCPHSYRPLEEKAWSTLYVTFGGTAASTILDSLELNEPAIYEEHDLLPFSDMLMGMIRNVEVESEFSRLELSSELYRFLIMLKKYGKMNHQPSLSSWYEKVRPVVTWLEEVYAENIGLPEMAEKAQVSPQYLNMLFQETFQMSPYSFLIQLRIREAKKILVSSTMITLKDVAKQVGYNDVSHFVASFRKLEGLTPNQYRHLYHAK